jgi:hypothetical protein
VKEGPASHPTSGSLGSWPNAKLQGGKICPPHPPGHIDQTPGPGSYKNLDTFDSAANRKLHATMGLPHQAKRSNVQPAPAASGMPVYPQPRVKQSTWQPRRSGHTEATPGPGEYHVCNSAFCACTNCEKIAQGKTFGLRPPVHTGQIPKKVTPGPASYHVDCTTIGAATRAVDCHEPRTHP